ncbi:PilW family protein [Methylococcus capsulatus]|uniref:PilW family protein n=1 Tax=Methylococcus capsulatus TaxID=414 RepID=UPI002016DB8A|nr:PilW family protein [Methylococcus capsulatus]UQN11354.1 PilW family protein [Methylococcus capsulatus]
MKIPRRSGLMGFSSVELLISMVLGLLVVGAIGSLFVQHKTNYRQNEQFALMQENGRFTLNLLASDLALAGFWGGADCNDLSRCPSASAISVQNDCGTNWTTTTTSSSPATHYLMAPSADSIPADWPCFNSNDYLKPGTNLLALRHAEGKPVYCQTGEDKRNDRFAGLIYLRTSGSNGNLVKLPVSTATPPEPPDCPVSSSSAAYWRYVVHVYYISRGYTARQCASKPTDPRCAPRLIRKTLGRQTGNPIIFESDDGGEIAEGIEYFHIEFGIDDGDGNMTDESCDMDGIPERYLSTREDYAAITPDELDCAISARVHVLVRSMESDSSYTDDKTYTFGSVTLGPFGDHFRRKVFTTTVQLRNQQYH